MEEEPGANRFIMIILTIILSLISLMLCAVEAIGCSLFSQADCLGDRETFTSLISYFAAGILFSIATVEYVKLKMKAANRLTALAVICFIVAVFELAS